MKWFVFGILGVMSLLVLSFAFAESENKDNSIDFSSMLYAEDKSSIDETVMVLKEQYDKVEITTNEYYFIVTFKRRKDNGVVSK